MMVHAMKRLELEMLTLRKALAAARSKPLHTPPARAAAALPDGLPRYLTTTQAAKLMGVAPRTVRARVQRGELPYVREHGDQRAKAVRIPRDQLLQYLATQPPWHKK